MRNKEVQDYDFPIIINWIGYDMPMTTIIKNIYYDVDRFIKEIQDDIFCELASVEHFDE